MVLAVVAVAVAAVASVVVQEADLAASVVVILAVAVLQDVGNMFAK